MNASKFAIDFRKNLSRLTAILLIAAIGLISSLDSPEALENVLRNRYSFSSDQTAIIGSSASALLKDNGKNFANAKDHKPNHFDEDYTIAWTTSSRPRLDSVGIKNDISTIKFKSFYGLGNLSPRYRLLAEYRDFIDLHNQQYGRSIH